MCNCKDKGVNGQFCCHQNQIETLGLVASGKRIVKDGRVFDRLFPKASFQDKIINPNGSVRYTVEQMEKVVQDYHWQTAELAKRLKTDSLPQTLNNVWSFMYKHFQYKLDKDGVEQLRTPARAWHDGQILSRHPDTAHRAGIDCDCFSITVACILTNLKIQHKFRITKYSAGWQHVYVVVPVPNKPQYNWIIDCVLDRFNTEKTYSDKFDYTMNGLGIPVEILNGINDAHDLQGIISGADFSIEGFGSADDDGMEGTNEEIGETEVQQMLASAADDLGALKRHLKRTRDYIAKNPESVVFQGGARNNLQRLDYVLSHWDTPNRMAALTEAAKHEHAVNVSMGFAGPDDFDPFDGVDDENDLSGILEVDEMGNLGDVDGVDGMDSDDEIDGLGKPKKGQKLIQNVRKAAGNVAKKTSAATKKVATVAKKAATKVAAPVKKAGAKVANSKVAKKTVAVTKKVAKKVGTATKKAVKAVVRYNPVTAAVRGGYLLFLSQGWLGMAKALRPAYYTAQEALSKGINAADYAASVRALANTTKIFVNTLQGKPENLKAAILKGATKNGLTGLTGIEDNELGLGAAVAASITAASVPIVATAKALDDAGVKDKEGFFKKIGKFFKNVGKKIKDKRTAKKEAKATKDAENKGGEGDNKPNADGGGSGEGGGEGDNKPGPQGKGAKGGGSSEDGGGSENGGNENEGGNNEDPFDKIIDTAQKAGDVIKNFTDGGGSGNDGGGNGGGNDAGANTPNNAPPPPNNDKDVSIFDKALNFAKANPVTVVLGSILTASAITLAVSPKARAAVFGKKQTASLSGPGKRKRKKKATKRRVVSPNTPYNKRKVKYIKM